MPRSKINKKFDIESRKHSSKHLRRVDYINLLPGDVLQRFTYCSPYEQPEYKNGLSIVQVNFPGRRLVQCKSERGETHYIDYSIKALNGMGDGGIIIRGSESFEHWYEDRYEKIVFEEFRETKLVQPRKGHYVTTGVWLFILLFVLAFAVLLLKACTSVN